MVENDLRNQDGTMPAFHQYCVLYAWLVIFILPSAAGTFYYTLFAKFILLCLNIIMVGRMQNILNLFSLNLKLPSTVKRQKYLRIFFIEDISCSACTVIKYYTKYLCNY